MKKPLLLALAVMMMLGVGASAAVISANCTLFPVTFTNGVGAGAVSCPGFTPGLPTDVLTAVSVTYSADYQFGSNGTNIVNVTFVPTGPTANWVPTSRTLAVTGTTSSGSIPTGSATYGGAVSNAIFAGAFNVNVSSAVAQGSAATSSGAVSVAYTFTQGVPEPSTFLLLGSALAGVALIRRRKK